MEKTKQVSCNIEVIQVGQRGIGAAGVFAVETHMGIANPHAECLAIADYAFNLIAVFFALGHHQIIVNTLLLQDIDEPVEHAAAQKTHSGFRAQIPACFQR